MNETREKLGALFLGVLMGLSVLAGTVAFSGAVVAATNTSISPSDDDADASGVTYTADGYVELANQDTLVYVDVHLGPADVSTVGSGDVQVFVDGTEYTDGLTEFSASNGTVEFKLSNSRSISDGDRVKIVVGDVTNPSDDFSANTTLHDSADDQWQEYTDSVSIDTPPDISYSDLTVNDTTLNVGDSLSVSALINNSGEQTGTYNASFQVDGSVRRYNNGTIQGESTLTTEFVESFGSAGDRNVSIGPLGTTEVTVTGPLAVVGGSANPSTVDANSTVSNQQIYVDVANVSQDGDTDTHYVEFPNALADDLSVNSVSANATSITSSPNLVEGYDDDGVTETVRFATSGDAGGDVNLNLTVDAGVSFPDTETIYGVDARTVDSGGENATQSDVATIRADAVPCICSYEVTNPADRDVAVSFNASEELTKIEAAVTNSSGSTVATLTEADFTGTNQSGTWVYDATYTATEDGDYTVTLNTAEDDEGNDGASGESGTVNLNTVSVGIHDGQADPSQVAPDTTVSNQVVTATLVNVSADGNTDTHYVEFPDALADGLSVNSASVNGTASIAQSAELVEGFDNDNVDDTVRFQTDTDAGGTVVLNVSVDVSVHYPDTETTYDVDARVEDSDGDTAQTTAVASITAAETQTPIITDFALSNPSGRNVTVAFNASEELSNISVELADGTGTTVATLTEANFTGTNESGTWTYTATHTVASDGDYTATLTTAADADGNDGASGQSDTVAVDTTPPSIAGGSATPAQVVAGETVNNQHIHVILDDVSADGDTDTHYVEVPDALAGNISVNSASANATSITSSAELVEGYDDDGVTETVRFATSSDAGGDIALNVSVDVSIDYPNTTTTYDVDARLEDSGGTTVDSSGVTSIEAVASENPDISNYAVSNPSDRDVQVSFDASRELSTISVDLADGTGATVATLTESDFTGTNESGTWPYTATYTVASGGDYTATLNTAADAQGNDGASDQSGSVFIETSTSDGGGGDDDSADFGGSDGSDDSDTTTDDTNDTTADETTDVVSPEDERAFFDLNESSAVDTVAVEFDVDATHTVSVTVPDQRPAPVQKAPGEVVTTLNITRPDAVDDVPVSLTLTVSADAFDAEESNLTVAHYHTDTGEWVRLDTEVVSRADSAVTLHANASHTSLFAVSAVEDSSERQSTGTRDVTDTPTETVTSTPEPLDVSATPEAETPEATTSATGPGFGVVVATLAMLGATLMALRRRR